MVAAVYFFMCIYDNWNKQYMFVCLSLYSSIHLFSVCAPIRFEYYLHSVRFDILWYFNYIKEYGIKIHLIDGWILISSFDRVKTLLPEFPEQVAADKVSDLVPDNPLSRVMESVIKPCEIERKAKLFAISILII